MEGYTKARPSTEAFFGRNERMHWAECKGGCDGQGMSEGIRQSAALNEGTIVGGKGQGMSGGIRQSAALNEGVFWTR